MKCEIKIDCEIPQVPNYLTTANGTFPLSAFTEEALKKIGSAWTEKLIARAKQLRQDGTDYAGTKLIR